MKKIFFLTMTVFFILFQSCRTVKQDTSQKTVTETDVKREVKEIEYKTIYRPKDSVIYYTVPNYIPRDTTIVVQGKTTTLKLNYDQSGTLIRADCTADEIKELSKTIREVKEAIKEDKTEKARTSIVDRTDKYLVPILLLIIIILLLFNSLKGLKNTEEKPR